MTLGRVGITWGRRGGGVVLQSGFGHLDRLNPFKWVPHERIVTVMSFTFQRVTEMHT
jgi:hypothetical protein